MGGGGQKQGFQAQYARCLPSFATTDSCCHIEKTRRQQVMKKGRVCLTFSSLASFLGLLSSGRSGPNITNSDLEDARSWNMCASSVD